MQNRQPCSIAFFGKAALCAGALGLGQLAAAATTTVSYTGPAVNITDNSPIGVNIILPVSGIAGNAVDVDFRLDSLPGCGNALGDVNASVTHSFNSDLAFRLTSPMGTTVALITNRGGGGDNFCTVLLDDDSGSPPASMIPTTGGVSGTFAPEAPLQVFDGQNPNGNWVLNVVDSAAIDTGTLNRFSLIITDQAAAGNLTISPAALTFPTTNIGSTSAATTVTLGNSGAGSLTVGSLTAATAPFARSGGTCSAVPITIAAGASCTLTYTFAPTATGPANQLLSVTANAPSTGSGTIALSGTGASAQVPITSNPVSGGTLSLPSMTVGGAATTAQITFQNPNNIAASITSCAIMAPGSANFSVNPTSLALSALGSGAITVTFNSTSAGNYSANLACTGTVGMAQQAFQFVLQGSATAAGVPPTQHSVPALSFTSKMLLALALVACAFVMIHRPID